jgi:putative DNA primase/helicase
MSDPVNYDDIVKQLTAAGLRPDTVKNSRSGYAIGALVVGSSQAVRCLTEDSPREAKGWYWLNTTDIADQDGRMQSYLIGSAGVWQADSNNKIALKLNIKGASKLSSDESAAMRARLADMQKRAAANRKDEARRAADLADRVWRAYSPTGESSYLVRKCVHGYGVRYNPNGKDTLAVPMTRDGRIVGLQLIRGADRGNKLQKQNWPAGLDMVGAYHLIGSTPAGVLLICEGFVTGCSLHEATGLPVAVCFSAGNLLRVSSELAKRYKASRLLICADDDYIQPCKQCKAATPVAVPACRACGEPHGWENPGITAAKNAATAVGGAWLAPEFAEERPTEKKGGPTDFNDLHAREGLHVVREQVEARLRDLQWNVAPARALPEHGGGERRGLPGLISVDEACERYALVYGGKGTLFDHREHALVPKSDVLDVLPDHGWREWKLRQDRQVVRLSEVGFDPACTDPAILCNLWGGWPTAPKQGKCERLLDLLAYLCSGEQNAGDLYQWALRWLAYPIQRHGAKMRTALIFHGPQGTGKNLFFEAVMSIYGEYGRIVDQAAIEDRFNDWASRKLFLIADEVVARQELYHVKNKLKSFVTGEWIRINPKNVAAHDEKNHVNLVYLSNEIQPLPLDADDRRHFVIWTPAKLSPDFYQEIRDELNNGGIAALHWHLLHLDLGEFDEHTKPPETQAKRDLMDVGAGNVQRFIRQWISGDVFVRVDDAPLPVCPCGSSDLYQAYLSWCRTDGVRNPREANQFIGEIAKIPGWSKGHKDRYPDTGCVGRPIRQRFIIPGADHMEAWAKAGHADRRKRDEQTQTQWLTDCFFAFQSATEVRR